ncbi:TMEM175 family protein [Streptomyces sp. MS06]|uniref:TMEM175 family protein n=1 Tax=Streptomyces sp. MS06 TaxID=3385974 RepID=UPI0039A07032
MKHDTPTQAQHGPPEPADLTEISTFRLEIFSDAVFAIAITLLILEIKVPSAEDGTMLHGLLALWPSYGAYLFSFLIIGVVWMNHHTMMHCIRRVDRVLLVLNLLLLMCVAFIPFSTAVLAEGLATGHGDRTAAVFYGLVLTVGGLPFNAIWWYASRDHRHLSHLITEAEADVIRRHFSMGPFLYLGATLVGLLSAVASLTCFALLILFYMIEVLGSRKSGPGPAHPDRDGRQSDPPAHGAVQLPVGPPELTAGPIPSDPQAPPHARPLPVVHAHAMPAAPARVAPPCPSCGRSDYSSASPQ